MTELLNQAQLAKLSDVSTKTVQRYVAEGKLLPLADGMFSIAQVGEVKKLWWGGKKSGKRKTDNSVSIGAMTAAKLAAARSLRERLRLRRDDATGFEDLL